MTMTYDAYDRLTEQFAVIQSRGKVPTIWPTVQQIDKFDLDPDAWVLFCCYLYECNPAPESALDKYSKKNLARFISDHLILTDD